MTAISATLPPAPSGRSRRHVDDDPPDDRFGAAIAAAIGLAPTHPADSSPAAAGATSSTPTDATPVAGPPASSAPPTPASDHAAVLPQPLAAPPTSPAALMPAPSVVAGLPVAVVTGTKAAPEKSGAAAVISAADNGELPAGTTGGSALVVNASPFSMTPAATEHVGGKPEHSPLPSGGASTPSPGTAALGTTAVATTALATTAVATTALAPAGLGGAQSTPAEGTAGGSDAARLAPHEQVVQLLAPLRLAHDGSYSLSLQLHPADLGVVTVHVDVHEGVLSLHLVSDHDQTRDVLRDSVADLRAHLEVSGVRAGDIDVGTDSRQSGSGQPGSAGQQPFEQRQSERDGPRQHGQPDVPFRDDEGARRPGVPSTAAAVAPSSPTHVTDVALDVRI